MALGLQGHIPLSALHRLAPRLEFNPQRRLESPDLLPAEERPPLPPQRGEALGELLPRSGYLLDLRVSLLSQAARRLDPRLHCSEALRRLCAAALRSEPGLRLHAQPLREAPHVSGEGRSPAPIAVQMRL